MASLLFVWLVDTLGCHLLARLVAQLEDWLVGWLVGCSFGGFFGCSVDGWGLICCPSVSLLVVGLVGGRGWRHDVSLVGCLLATPMVLVASANFAVQLASQSINIRTR